MRYLWRSESKWRPTTDCIASRREGTCCTLDIETNCRTQPPIAVTSSSTSYRSSQIVVLFRSSWMPGALTFRIRPRVHSRPLIAMHAARLRDEEPRYNSRDHTRHTHQSR